ncbi:MAG: polar amino acid transport system permease protein [Chthoniobacter sp.]|jgi:polar amino acid transport system permease protein|nr:polar amino acid transport system permease protein [Chthoniobacter sp.]
MTFRSLLLRPERSATAPGIRLFNYTLATALLFAAFYLCFRSSVYRWDWAAVYIYRQKFLRGWATTILIAITALGLSTILGLLAALARRSRILLLSYLAKICVELIRGTPLLVQILIFFYVIADAIGAQNRYVVGVVTLSIFSGAYISEIMRAGIESVGKSQLDAAQAVGFTRAQTYRYVIFPQALRQTLPPLAGQFVSLVKDSSLLMIIGISEFTLNAREVASYTLSSFESYLPLAAGYLALTLPISLWARHLEARARFET